MSPISVAGRFLMSTAEDAGYASLLFFRTLREMRHVFRRAPAVAEQMYRVGVSSLPVVLLVALFSGMVLALQSGIELTKYGVQGQIGAIVAGAMCREMGPIMTAITLAGLVGSAIAAELGTMRVSDEIDALEVMSINPIRFLVMPRFVALMIFTPALTVIADLVGTVGGAVVGNYQVGVSYKAYFDSAQEVLLLVDVYGGLAKAFVFGIIIAIVASSEGLRASHGAAGVGKATRSSVVVSFILIIVFNYFLTSILRYFY